MGLMLPTFLLATERAGTLAEDEQETVEVAGVEDAAIVIEVDIVAVSTGRDTGAFREDGEKSVDVSRVERGTVVVEVDSIACKTG